MHVSSLLLSALLAPLSVVAHPGHHEALSYNELTRRASLSKRCEGAAAAMNAKRWVRHQEKRSLASRANTSVVITTEAPYYESIQNDTCVLTPDVTPGPYVWPRSQTLRQDMAEDQGGVPLYLDIGVLDVNTCEPLEGVLVDLWHCNATGYYSSFEGNNPNTPFAELVASLNISTTPPANGTMPVFDLHTGNSTFLRGLWPTDSNGMMEMKTVFPGFYVQRSIHIHAQVHTNWVIGTNGTIVSDETISTGQIFFTEDLTETIMAMEPYVNHTQINRTTNAIDDIYAGAATGGYNPIMSVVPLDGEDVTKGMVGYITLGVDTSA